MKKAKGRFEGVVKAQWLAGGRRMRLLAEVAFIDKKGHRWVAPQDAVIDGASIPVMFWSSIGSPFVGKYRRASVLHDVACVERTRSYKAVHKMFLEAMLADRTPKGLARKMYLAVATFGPKWDKDGKDLDFTPESDEELFFG